MLSCPPLKNLWQREDYNVSAVLSLEHFCRFVWQNPPILFTRAGVQLAA